VIGACCLLTRLRTDRIAQLDPAATPATACPTCTPGALTAAAEDDTTTIHGVTGVAGHVLDQHVRRLQSTKRAALACMAIFGHTDLRDELAEAAEGRSPLGSARRAGCGPKRRRARGVNAPVAFDDSGVVLDASTQWFRSRFQRPLWA